MLADTIVLIHFAFAVFAVFGGILCFWWRKIIWFHVPAVIWSALVETAGWICPLTPLENILRIRGGTSGYKGGFVENYILPVLYPENLTRELQVVLGASVVFVNLIVYGFIFLRPITKIKETAVNYSKDPCDDP